MNDLNSLQSDLTFIINLLEELTSRTVGPLKIIAAYIRSKKKVTSSTSHMAAIALFTMLIWYKSALQKYIAEDGKIDTFTEDFFLMKSKDDFEMDVDDVTLRKYFLLLQELRLIEYKPQASITLIKPLAENVYEAYTEQKAIVDAKREETNNSPSNNKLKKMGEEFKQEQKEISELKNTPKEERESRIEEITNKYNHTVSDLYLISTLSDVYGPLKLADYNKVRSFLGGRDFIFNLKTMDLIKQSKDMYDELSQQGWVKTKYKGARIVMAIRNLKSPNTFKDFNKKEEVVEAPKVEVIKTEERNDSLRLRMFS